MRWANSGFRAHSCKSVVWISSLYYHGWCVSHNTDAPLISSHHVRSRRVAEQNASSLLSGLGDVHALSYRSPHKSSSWCPTCLAALSPLSSRGLAARPSQFKGRKKAVQCNGQSEQAILRAPAHKIGGSGSGRPASRPRPSIWIPLLLPLMKAARTSVLSNAELSRPGWS